jgi:hypothetical protein
MTQQTIDGDFNTLIPSHHRLLWPITASDVTMDLATEGVHLVGNLFLPGRTGSKTISAAGGGQLLWLTGASAVFTNGSTGLRVGIQDVSSSGQPAHGDHSFDVYADLVGGVDALTSSTWKTVSMGTGTKTIAHNDKICIAFEMLTRGGSDSVPIRGASSHATQGWPGTTLVTAGPAYSAQAQIPNALIVFDDATFGWIKGSWITSTGAVFTSTNVQVGTAVADEWCNILRFPFPVTIDGLWVGAGFNPSTVDCELILYEDPLGTPNALETLTIDADHVQVNTRRVVELQLPAPRALDANTDYAVALRPTTANVVGMTNFDTNSEAHMIAHPLGTNCYLGKRLDQTGAFTGTLSQRMWIGVNVCGFGDDLGGSGGGQRIISG